jgi:hypothetical protein
MTFTSNAHALFRRATIDYAAPEIGAATKSLMSECIGNIISDMP